MQRSAQPNLFVKRKPSMDDLRDLLYRRLINEYQFKPIEQSRIPGATHIVVKDEVEVAAKVFSRALVFKQGAGARAARVVVDVRVPVAGSENSLFRRLTCGKVRYLSQKVDIVIRTVADLELYLPCIIG
jgi:hypothetical protein